MTTYEAVPNTDGQILIPVRKKQTVLPQPNIPRTVPPSQRPQGKKIPTGRFGARLRPQSPPFQRPVYRSRIRRPEALRLEQRQIPKYDSSKRLVPRNSVNRRVGACNSSTRHLQDSNTGTLGSRASNQSIISNSSSFVRPKEDPPIKAKDHKHTNIMSLSYIMEQQPSEQKIHRGIPNILNSRHHILNQANVVSLQNSLLNTPVKIEEIEQAVRSFEFGGDTGRSGTTQFRAERRLPPIEEGGAGYYQSHPNYMVSSPLTLPRSIPRTTASTDLSTLEHTAITTLASLNRFFDSKKLYPSATTSAPNPDSPVPTSEGDRTHSPSLKRLSSQISTHMPTETHESTLPTSPEMTELDPSKKIIRISSIPNSTSTPSASTLSTPQNQSTGSLSGETPFTHDSNKIASDFENDSLMPSLPSDAYPSPPKSASLSSSVPLMTSPLPLFLRDTSISVSKRSTDPQSHLDSSSGRAYRSPAPSPPSLPQLRVHTPSLTRTAPRSLVPMSTDIRQPTQLPQSQLLFFGHQAYSSLPARSSPITRSSSPPLSSSPSFISPSLSTHHDSNSLPRKNFAYRAWKMCPSSSILTGLSDSTPPQ
ncbi:hypothetical protein BOTNAR_0622g00020 [Botryotinia narcissicola]|uniref:Uncharacterized protein n=1 Tax=Botryotinia narcissicola TaxID=278944 RepID=A0A4Z1HA18_9HELO|nr:hypothetical protein BOTNAR_0622g00020 [Botryotinia narcissicola]